MGSAEPMFARGVPDYTRTRLYVTSDIARMTRVPMIEASYPPEEVGTRQVFNKATGPYPSHNRASPTARQDGNIKARLDTMYLSNRDLHTAAKGSGYGCVGL